MILTMMTTIHQRHNFLSHTILGVLSRNLWVLHHPSLEGRTATGCRAVHTTAS